MDNKLAFKENERLWDVHGTKGIIAKIFIDVFHQMDVLVFFASTEEEKKKVLELCCNHVYRFAKYRNKTPHMLPILSERFVLTKHEETTSMSIMDFSAVDERFKKADEKALRGFLGAFDIPVIDGIVFEFEDALKKSVKDIIKSTKIKIKYELVRYNCLSDALKIKFTSKETFTFWKDSFKYEKEYESIYIHLIPHYHPANQGKTPLSLNGSTDAYIRGKAVQSICSPPECRTTARTLFSSWSHVNHPFFVTGKSFEMEISRTHFLSQEGMGEVTEILKAALGTTDKYVASIGGFNPPYRCPHNRLIDIRHSGKRPNPRGSEAHCVWAYRTLEKEGQLENTYIPDWFFKEKWLEKYEGAEYQPGVY